MQTVRLGRTGLEVSVVCLGAGGHSRLGGSTGASRAHSIALIRAALDAGVSFLDTAAAYGNEDIVGEAVRGRRDEVVISTKAQIVPSGAPTTGLEVIDGAELRRRVEASLARLGTGTIDILHLHGVMAAQYEHCRAELVPALMRLREAGKVRFFGLTERFIHDTRHEMLELALGDDVWDVVMVGLNLVNQTALRSVLPRARAGDVGTMCMFAVRGPLAEPSRARRLVDRLVARGEVDAALIDRKDPLGFLIAEGGARSLADAAYRYCRHAPGIDVVLTGTGSLAHLEENIASINDGPLAAAALARLADIFGRAESESAEQE